MTCVFHIVKHTPDNIVEIKMEDVASYQVLDNAVIVKFNNSPDEIIPLVNDDKQTQGEWFGFSSFNTRIGLQIDMNK